MTMRDPSEVIAVDAQEAAKWLESLAGRTDSNMDAACLFAAAVLIRKLSTPQPASADVVALKAIVADMRDWASGEGCFNDDPEGEPLLCVYWAQQPFLSLCDQIDAAIKGDSHA